MTELTSRWLVFTASVACSMGWLAYYILCVGQSQHADRGGSLGVAITLAFLFVNRNLGSRLYDVLGHRAPKLEKMIRDDGAAENPPSSEERIQQLERKLELLARSIDVEGDGRRTADIFLAVATVIGTIVGAFGESIAEYFLELMR